DAGRVAMRAWLGRIWDGVLALEGKLSTTHKALIAIAGIVTLLWTWGVPAMTGGWEAVRNVATRPYVKLKIGQHESKHARANLPLEIEVRDGTLWRIWREILRDQRDIDALEQKQRKGGLDAADTRKLIGLREEVQTLKAKYAELGAKQKEAQALMLTPLMIQ